MHQHSRLHRKYVVRRQRLRAARVIEVVDSKRSAVHKCHGFIEEGSEGGTVQP